MKYLKLFRLFESSQFSSKISKFEFINLISSNKLNYSMDPILIKEILKWDKIYKSSYNTFYNKEKGRGKLFTIDDTIRICDHRGEGSKTIDNNSWNVSIYQKYGWNFYDINKQSIFPKKNFKVETLNISNKIKKEINRLIELEKLEANGTAQYVSQLEAELASVNARYSKLVHHNLYGGR